MDRDDIERQLQDYFASERAEVRAPADLWANVSARLGPQEPAPWWRRMFAGASLQGAGRVYAGAAAALAVAVVGAVMYGAIFGFDGGGRRRARRVRGVRLADDDRCRVLDGSRPRATVHTDACPCARIGRDGPCSRDVGIRHHGGLRPASALRHDAERVRRQGVPPRNRPSVRSGDSQATSGATYSGSRCRRAGGPALPRTWTECGWACSPVPT